MFNASTFDPRHFTPKAKEDSAAVGLSQWLHFCKWIGCFKKGAICSQATRSVQSGALERLDFGSRMEELSHPQSGEAERYSRWFPKISQHVSLLLMAMMKISSMRLGISRLVGYTDVAGCSF